jgi:type II secretory pathway component PulL
MAEHIVKIATFALWVVSLACSAYATVLNHRTLKQIRANEMRLFASLTPDQRARWLTPSELRRFARYAQKAA